MNPMLQEYLDEVTARRARELEKLKKENTLLRAQYAYANFRAGHPLPPFTQFRKGGEFTRLVFTPFPSNHHL